MTSTPEPIVQPLQGEFQPLLAYVTGPDARSQTAYTVELTLFWRRLTLGAALLRLCWVTRAVYGATDESYRERQTVLERLLGRCGSMAIGRPIGRVIGRTNISGGMASPPQRWRRQKPERWSWLPDQPAVHEFWSHSHDLIR